MESLFMRIRFGRQGVQDGVPEIGCEARRQERGLRLREAGHPDLLRMYNRTAAKRTSLAAVFEPPYVPFDCPPLADRRVF